jgi:hypothetical protein
MPEQIPGPPHPDQWRKDLNPDFMAGQNFEEARSEREESRHNAYDVKRAHRQLSWLTDDELRNIPLLPPGTRLEQGATYIDLSAPEPREFTATGDMEAGERNLLVPKSEVDYELWNRLTERRAA